ncbi:hypothetical protein SeLEV6574_g08527, partial [Synchytrium endobioticum]
MSAARISVRTFEGHHIGQIAEYHYHESYNSFVYKVPVGKKSKNAVKQRKQPKIYTPKSLKRVRNPSSCVTSL